MGTASCPTNFTTYCFCYQFAGGGKRDRTADLLHAMQALSQLSYTPVCRSEIIASLFSACKSRFADLLQICISIVLHMWRNFQNAADSRQARRMAARVNRSTSGNIAWACSVAGRAKTALMKPRCLWNISSSSPLRLHASQHECNCCHRLFAEFDESRRYPAGKQNAGNAHTHIPQRLKKDIHGHARLLSS